MLLRVCTENAADVALAVLRKAAFPEATLG